MGYRVFGVFSFGFIVFSAGVWLQYTIEPAGKTEEYILHEEFHELPVSKKIDSFTGDLDAIRQRNQLRVLVSYDKTRFFLTQEGPRGFDYDLFQQYEKFLNEGIGKKQAQINVIFIPVPFDQLIPQLQSGRGDVIAAGMTVTPQRREEVSFTTPYLHDVDEVVVAHEDVDDLDSLLDLSNRMVYVLNSSSYEEHLKELNNKFSDLEHEPVKIEVSKENLATEDILELVNAGIVPITVADRHTAQIWQNVLDCIVVRDDLIVHHKGNIAFAVRKNNPNLLQHLNQFVKTIRRGTLIGNMLFKRYYVNTQWIQNPLTGQNAEQLSEYQPYFQKYARQYDFDWRFIAAVAFQESKFNPKAKSPGGAVGIMQVMPRTAADPRINIQKVQAVESNIHAGVKIMHMYRNRFVESEMEEDEKIDFTLASYNAGYSRIQRLREKAEKESAINSNRWNGHVEKLALQTIGRETVRYVSNVHKYHIAFNLSAHLLEQRQVEVEQAKQTLETGP